MTLKKYLVLKWSTLGVAALVIGVVWVFLPHLLITVFDFNTVWLGAIWSWIEPVLPSEASVPINAVQTIYASLIATIHGISSLLSDHMAAQVEAAARGFLGEGWIVVVQLAIVLRVLWLLLVALFRRREYPEVGLVRH